MNKMKTFKQLLWFITGTSEFIFLARNEYGEYEHLQLAPQIDTQKLLANIANDLHQVNHRFHNCFRDYRIPGRVYKLLIFIQTIFKNQDFNLYGYC